MQKVYGRVAGWGCYIPKRKVSNHELAQSLDTSHEWIVRRTGIFSRHIASNDETTSRMAIEAARRALDTAQLDPLELDMIILTTNTPDYLVAPSPSSQLQHGIGAIDVPAFTLAAGCTGYLYGLSVAQNFIGSGMAQNVLIVGSERVSQYVDWQDRSTAVLFGDGAGALILQATTQSCGPQHFVLGSDGSGAESIMVPSGGSVDPFSAGTLAARSQYVTMKGREVFKFAARKMTESCQEVLALADLEIDGIDWMIPHQANHRIITAGARELGMPLERCVINLNRYGNTSVASIPIGLCEGIESGEIGMDDTLLLVAFGAGLTWGACLLELAPLSLKQEEVINSRIPALI